MLKSLDHQALVQCIVAADGGLVSRVALKLRQVEHHSETVRFCIVRVCKNQGESKLVSFRCNERIFVAGFGACS